ncbi:MAG: HAMP domain-containing protein, partial [Deltaproteobacteria bacterium]|nr:HAMP domain-containing protein [Deltaproteobacteria bacterium]
MLSTIGRYTLFWVITLVILPLALVSATVYNQGRHILEEEILSSLHIISAGLRSKLLLVLDMKKSRALDFSSDGFIRESLKNINSNIQPAKNSAALSTHLSKNKAPLDPDIYNILVFNKNGKVAASTNGSLAGDAMEGKGYFERGKTAIAVSTIKSFMGERLFSISAPLADIHTNEFLGVITLRYRASLVDNVLAASPKEAAQSRLHANMLAYITDKDKDVLAGPQIHLGKAADTEIAKKALSHSHAEGRFIDIDNIQKMGTASVLGEPGWLMVVAVPTDIVFAPLNKLAMNVFFLITPFLILSVIVTLILAKKISNPIVEVANAAERIADGRWNERIKTSDKKGETLKLANSFNSMVLRLHDSFAALKKSELFNENIVDAMPSGLIVLDKELKIISVNKGFGAIFGLHAVSLHGQSVIDLLKRFCMDLAVIEAIQANKELNNIEVSCQADEKGFGKNKMLSISTTKTDGAAGERLLIIDDITLKKETEEELRQGREQLREAQKMEALGRLSGGIAHDFNNILTAIMGYTDLQLMRYEEGHPMRANMEKIQKASERAKGLTTQLLAFSRKQVIHPTALNLNTVISGMHDMIERLIGENVKLKSNLCPHIIPVMADKSQIEQVILNLIVNARDAMPEGGNITIETFITDRDRSKDFVCISVSDTGSG